MAARRDLSKDVPVDPITIAEVAAIAQKNLLPNVWNYYECGADEQQALDRNTRDFDR